MRFELVNTLCFRYGGFPRRFVSLLGMLVACVSTLAIEAQAPAVLTLSSPEAVLGHEFTFIEDVHELPDGQLAVLDRGDVSVFLADPAFRIARPVGRIGSGPGEYRAPKRLFGMANTQFAVLNSRFHLLRYGADGRYVDAPRPQELVRCGKGVQSPVGNTTFSATDATGRVYLQGPPIARDPSGQFQLADSAPILRWTPPCVLDTVAFTPAPPADGQRVQLRADGMPFVAGAPDLSQFGSTSQWAVLPDGRIVILHLAPYRVEIVDADGRRERGANIADAAIPVTEGHKAQWRREQQRSRPTVTFSRGGGMSTSMRTKRYSEPEAWPRMLPPFPRDAVRAAPDGRIWVQGNVLAGAAQTVDVFDTRARRVQQVVLPAGRRLLAVGRGMVYLLYQDDDDLQYVERYRLPASP